MSESNGAPHFEPLALRPAEAARALGLSERKFRDISVHLPSVILGGVRRYPVDELRRWLSANASTASARIDDAAYEALRNVAPEPECSEAPRDSDLGEDQRSAL